jgi:signal transduction histidine kinase
MPFYDLITNYYDLINLLNKIIGVFFVSIFVFLLMYIIVITYDINKEKFKKIVIASTFFIMTFSIIVCFTNVTPVKVKDVANVSGSTTIVTYIFVAILLCTTMLISIINFRKMDKRHAPIFVIFGLLIMCYFATLLLPNIIIYDLALVLFCYIMYFTLENPDLKMIEELAKARVASEQSNDEKTKFLYEANVDTNLILNSIEKVRDNVLKNNPNVNIKNEMDDLTKILNTARTKAKQTLDISELDTKYLKAINTKYNIKLLVSSIYLQIKPKVNPNVDFRLNIVDNLPNEVYGDSIKLKQILVTLLNNAVTFTQSGFIELKVNFIVKYDLCRLIFTIEDSGKGIDITEINNIMTDHTEISDEELSHLDDSNLNLKIIRKMINSIGGTMTIESILNKGTNIKVSLDQKIVEETKDKEITKMEQYSDQLTNKKKIAVISLYENEYRTIKNALNKNEYEIDYYKVTLDCLIKIRNDYNYDFIFIDENMDKIDAKSFIYKTKEVDSFNGKIFVISNSKDITNKKEYLDLNANIINLPLAKEEIRNKIKNHSNE